MKRKVDCADVIDRLRKERRKTRDPAVLGKWLESAKMAVKEEEKEVRS